MLNYTILAVDDEEHILELIEYNLKQQGFSIKTASSGEEAIYIMKNEKIELVLLDIMMDGMDGIEVLSIMKKDEELAHLPVIFLTAKTEEIDKVMGLELGADDYIAKPFGVRELAARIKAVLRRTLKITELVEEAPGEGDALKNGKLKINKITRDVMVDDKNIDFALKEFELLYLLVKHAGIVYSREQLLEKVWGYDFYGETRTVDVHIRNIRKKLEENGMNPDCIKTVRGVGYKYQLED